MTTDNMVYDVTLSLFPIPKRCNIIRDGLQYPCDAHQVHNAHPDELLPVAEEDEADDDVGGDDVQVAEELGQHPRNVAEGTLQRTSTISRWGTGYFGD